ncbi:MAG TPA: hypothetical protein VEX37_13570 [Thermomicrobiales bacterium]|nr:hypothetical protein [Thermomicrobiales bacterium]
MKSVLLTLGMVCLLLFSACGGGDSDDPTATTAATEASGDATVTEQATDTPAATATATEDAAEPTSTTAAAASPTATDDAESTPADIDPDLAEEIEEIKAQTVEVRGLELLEEVPITVITREELRQNLTEDVTSDYSQDEADQDTEELWLLRLIEDPDLDLYAFQIDLLTEQVLGYYDPELDEMFIVSDEDGLSALAEYTLSHELVHSIQDQHFDIQEVRFYDQGDNDRDAAAVALIEGDAQIAQMQYVETMSPTELLELLTEAGSMSSEVVDSAPPYLRDSLYFPYEAGLTFVQSMYQENGFDTINEVFEDPPTSTEQIMHPEKYRGQRDDPQHVELTDLTVALGDGWEEVDTDSLGEFDLSVLLRENGAPDYAEAAAGWGGGRYVYYEGDAGSLMAVKTVWDSPDDVTEFYDAMLTTLAGPLDGEIGDAGQGRFLGLHEVDGAVWFITSTDRSSVETALAGISG